MSEDKALDCLFVVAATLLDMEPDSFVRGYADEHCTPGELLEARNDICSLTSTEIPDAVRIQRVPLQIGEGREITEHRDNNPRQFCTVHAGEPNRGGAPVVYRIGLDIQVTGYEGEHPATHFIRFQDGHPQEGFNGILDTALLAVLIDRQRGFLEGPWPSEEGRKALHHLQEALAAMDARVADRVERGVMNTDQE